jgi:hypothetical protein
MRPTSLRACGGRYVVRRSTGERLTSLRSCVIGERLHLDRGQVPQVWLQSGKDLKQGATRVLTTRPYRGIKPPGGRACGGRYGVRSSSRMRPTSLRSYLLQSVLSYTVGLAPKRQRRETGARRAGQVPSRAGLTPSRAGLTPSHWGLTPSHWGANPEPCGANPEPCGANPEPCGAIPEPCGNSPEPCRVWLQNGKDPKQDIAVSLLFQSTRVPWGVKLGARRICSPAYDTRSRRNLQYPAALRGFFILF